MRLALNKSKGNALKERLRNHARSIEGTATLDIVDFHVRYFQVEDI